MMKVNEYIRNKAFTLVDALRKESIQKYVKELQVFENEANQHSIITKKLSQLLCEAQRSSPFYKREKEEFNLNAYSIITKRILRDNEGQIQSLAHRKNKLIKISTSGSYGTPFCFYITPKKKKIQKAEVIYYGANVGYEVGVQHGYFRTTLPKSWLKLWLQNETYICSKVLGTDFLIETRSLLKKKKLKILIGFPSAIAILAQFCIEQGDGPTNFAIEGVLTFAENLTAKQRECISLLFGCEVYSRYGTEELGILGCQQDNESGFKLNTCNYIVEVLKLHEDVSVLPGEMGRVVVTDLYSDAFPLIRYETGDLAILGEVFEENNGWAKSFKGLSGRTIQILYATNGEKLYPLYFENIIERNGFFVQYQLIQDSEKEFILKLVPKTTINIAEFSDTKLINELTDWLGHDAHIKLEIVKDIEMLPSGKRPSIINKLAHV